jgi:FtsP/CotA-like multicopper oxidase with cupredoxin domain
MNVPLRKLLSGLSLTAVLALALSGCNGSTDGSPVDDLVIIHSDGGLLEATLIVSEETSNVGSLTAVTAVYNGRIPGPVLKARPGDTIRVHLLNQLAPTSGLPPGAHDPNTTNLHFHGLHVSPSGNADNVFLEVEPGMTFDYEFTVPTDHPGGFFWYHPHFHGNVSRQVGSGMAGGIVIEGELDDVPAVAAARERFLILNELTLDDTGHVPPGIFDPYTSHLTVNGLLQPAIDMRPGEVQRWRILAASGNRYFLLSLDGHQLHQIALDGIPFAAPVAQNQILVIPGQRIEVLVQAGAEGDYQLRALAYDAGGSGGSIPQDEVTLANVAVAGHSVGDVLPSTLVTPPPPAGTPVVGRSFTFDFVGSAGTVNGIEFDPATIVASPVLDTTEEWLISDGAGIQHPFHLHTQPFQVVAISGIPVASPVWQDTANVPAGGSILVRIDFKTFTGKAVFHCHILPHEDIGMMAAYETIP